MSDFALLRAAIAWGRANGWRYDGGGTEKSWEREQDGYAIVGIEHYQGCDDASLHIIDNGYETLTTARSVQQAVDVLVALGVLPPRLSSAYAAGQAAACIQVIAAASGHDIASAGTET